MCTIDEIMDMLDWNNPLSVQQKGRELAKDIRCINVFIQPMHKGHAKNVWDNCAIILANRSDEELTPYLSQLFDWLHDLNWPGAPCILNRLKTYQKNKEYLRFVLNECLFEAKALGEENWLNVLLSFQDNA